MAGQWIVLLEATDAGEAGSVRRDDVIRLLAAVDHHAGGDGGGALQSSDRYALQLTTTAPGPAEALVGVLSSWADAVRKLDLPTWQIVRTEVLTPEELERDEQKHLCDEMAIALAAGRRPRRQTCPRRRPAPPHLL